MLSQRRLFLKSSSLLAGAALFGKPVHALAAVTKRINSLAMQNSIRIYHTGNLNGCIEYNQQREAGLTGIKHLIGRQEYMGLVLDAGNFIGDSPAIAAQQKTIALMNSIGYEAVNLGSQELSLGREGLMELLHQAAFSLLNCNYTFKDRILTTRIKSYQIISYGKLKIGITGVAKKVLAEGLTFDNPMRCANRVAKYLKDSKKCDLVICLSQLEEHSEGYTQGALAAGSSHIDLIIGNQQKVHTGALILKNAQQHDVVCCGSGAEGALLGKTTYTFNTDGNHIDLQHKYLVVGQAFDQNPVLACRRLHELSNQIAADPFSSQIT